MAKQAPVSYDDVLDKIEDATALVEILSEHDHTMPVDPETLSRAAAVIRRELVGLSALYTRLCEERGIIRRPAARKVA